MCFLAACRCGAGGGQGEAGRLGRGSAGDESCWASSHPGTGADSPGQPVLPAQLGHRGRLWPSFTGTCSPGRPGWLAGSEGSCRVGPPATSLGDSPGAAGPQVAESGVVCVALAVRAPPLPVARPD